MKYRIELSEDEAQELADELKGLTDLMLRKLIEEPELTHRYRVLSRFLFFRLEGAQPIFQWTELFSSRTWKHPQTLTARASGNQISRTKKH